MFLLTKRCFFLIIGLCYGWLGVAQSFDTLPLLYCVDRDLSSGNPLLKWVNPPVQTCGPATAVIIQGKISAAENFMPLDTIPLTGTNEASVEMRFASIFRLVFLYPSCSASEARIYSSVLGFARTEPISIDRVSIDDEDVVLSWKPYLEGTPGISYRITKVSQPGELEMTIVEDLRDTFFRIENGARSPNTIYYLYAIDSCGIVSRDLPFSVIQLKGHSINPCLGLGSLEWSPSILVGDSTYYIQWRPAEGSWELIGTTTSTEADIMFPTDTTDFEFRVFTLNTRGDTSISNTLSFSFPPYSRPEFFSIINASFDLDNSLMVWVLLDEEASYEELSLLENNEVYSFSDTDSRSLVISNPSFLANTSYILSVTDDCAIVDSSDPFYSPLLRVERLLSGVRLFTTSSLSPLHIIQEYRWYRVNESGSKELLGSSKTPEWLLNQTDVSSGCFMVEIESSFGHPATSQDTVVLSQSNQLCLDDGFEVFMPNVFCLSCSSEEENHIIRPWFSNPSLVVEYDFEIYNRWGVRVYSSSSPTNYWGQFSSLQSFADETYLYLLRFRLDSGNERFVNGTFLLLP